MLEKLESRCILLFPYPSYFCPMNIALFGYGKMGHEVEAAAIERGHAIVATFDRPEEITLEKLREANSDVIIDFTEPSAVKGNVERACAVKLPIVIGTTGWSEDRDVVEKMIAEAGTSGIVASNFSIGVNAFLQIVRKASHLLEAADYDAYVLETHHRMKKDHPSGTALQIAKVMISEMPSKNEIVHDLPQGEVVPSNALVVSSLRSGAVTGTHTVGFESEVDSIELTHRAKSRKGFAVGAVRAAEWIVGKKGFFQFEEMIEEILSVKF
jgi:4-hydroxy-tetrahydrodipicolinate reductase